jgi:basic amino acid/polyamine antiporter, APA family
MGKGIFRTKSIESILKGGSDDAHGGDGLKRVLGVKDLTFFGIAAILGAGSFSSLGGAVFSGGPGVILLFIITAIACAFTAYCYSEFASRIPIAGSAYTYAYASFGELFAWVIGWALIMEYSIGNIYVAYSWSDYFTSFLDKLGVHIPNYLSTSYMEVKHAIEAGTDKKDILQTWDNAPRIAGIRCIVDVPAFIINILITYLVFRGVKESKNFSNVMVVLKMAVVAIVILVGGYYVFANGLTENWMPTNDAGKSSFMPNGFSGVMMAVSGVFFAYIGFDAVSVLAEESKNPQKDLPRGMILSLVICTIVYILLTLVLTGTVDYNGFKDVSDPLAYIFEPQHLNIGWMQFLVSICAVVAMTSVLLVFQMGQPRIWMSMSRDGLLPPVFQKIHSKYKTPSFSTIVTGAVVGLPIIFTDKTFVLDFTSIATLFAFVLVCGGILLIPRRAKEAGKFHMPYINGKFIYPLLIGSTIALLQCKAPHYFKNLFAFTVLPETKQEVTHNFISDNLSDFKTTHLLNKQDLIYVKKRFTTTEQKDNIQRVIDNNRSIIAYVDSTVYTLLTNTAQYVNADTTTFSLPNNSISVQKMFSSINIQKKIDVKSIIEILDPIKDSSLLQKCYAQQRIVNSYLQIDSNANTALDYQQQINKAFSNINMNGIQKNLAHKLEAQHIFNISSLAFWGICILLSIIGLSKNYSLIPLLGLTACMYLLTGMSMNNWIWFLGWLALGLVVYALYGYHKSKLLNIDNQLIS